MANIQEYLNRIMEARKGKEVRSSIHDSIDAINIQLEESGEAALASANNAAQSADNALINATNACAYAKKAQSYAVGTGEVRDNEAVDNAKYYYQQIKQISEGLAGGLLPMGTISFDQLENQTKAPGYMYNISDEFETDDTFKDGNGIIYPAGTNVYYTADGFWDCLTGSLVTGIKGSEESTYRKGNVDITCENIGALSTTGDSANNTIIFESNDEITEENVWTEVPVLESGEKHKSIFNKISTMFHNIRYLYNLLGNTYIGEIGNGTVTGAVAAQNETLANIKNYLQSQIAITAAISYETYGSITVPAGEGIHLIVDNIKIDGYEWIGIRNQYWGGANFIHAFFDTETRLVIINSSNNNTITIDRWYLYLVYVKKFV